MTIATETSRSGPYAGAGSAGPFTVSFRFLDQSHLQVVRTSTTGIDTTLTLSTHYSVSGAGNPTGSVTLVSALLVGEKLTIIRDVPFTQEADYLANDSFPAESHEAALDKLTQQTQQLNERLARAIVLDVGSTAGVTLPSIVSRAGNLLGFDAQGNVIVAAPVSGSASDVLVSLGNNTDANKGTALSGHIADGAGSVGTTAQTKLRERISVRDKGADPTGAVNATAAFTAAGSDFAATQVNVTRGNYLLNTDPAPTGAVTWVMDNGATLTGAGKLRASDHVVKFGPGLSWVSDSTLFSGIFGYLETQTALNVYGKAEGLGVFGATRSSTGSGGVFGANIGLSAFGLNDKVGGLAGVWGLYSTVLRKAGVLGPTHGMEIDVANMAATVPIFPHSMFVDGQTNGIWLCTGGEATNNAAVLTASCALAIVQNDSAVTKTAKFDKGIVFDGKAIAGTDGLTGNGIAIAFSSRHQQVWFNTANQAVGELVCNTGNAANALRVDLGDTGLLVQDRTSGAVQFQVQNTPSAPNYLSTVSGGVPELRVAGISTDADLYLVPKGAGVVRFGAFTGGAVAQTGYITVKDNGGTVRRLLVG